jgi:hypothetical protein
VVKRLGSRGSAVGVVLVALLIVALFAVGFSACAPAKTKAPERASSEEPYDFEKEGNIPPKDTEIAAEVDVEEIPVEEEEVVAENVEAPKDTTRVAGGGPGGVQGKDGTVAIPVFRVQVLATTSEQSALDTKAEVERRLGVDAHVTFEDGMYKVRVGDCANRTEAEKVRRKCREAGYTDAWIVSDVRAAGP